MSATATTSMQWVWRTMLVGVIAMVSVLICLSANGAKAGSPATGQSQPESAGAQPFNLESMLKIAPKSGANTANTSYFPGSEGLPSLLTPPNTPVYNGFAHFNPAGPLTVTVGTKFTLDLMVNSGTDPRVFVTGAQHFLTFTNSVIQNVNVTQSGCVLTSTVTTDNTTFNAQLLNETCNGPSQCIFRGQPTSPGSMAYASGVLGGNPPAQGDFRVARVAFCAVGAGTARIHWQFSPPDPLNRNSYIVDENSNTVSVPALYTDYVVHVTAPQLVGHVTWQGPPVQPNARQQLPITITLKSGTTEVNYASQNTDSSGFFTVSLGSLAPGSYNWRVKGPKYLANSGSVTLTGGATTSSEMGIMRSGDCNNDNVITTLDFTILKGTFGKALGDPGYDDRADFTGDRIVNTSDFTALKNNFGLGGAPPIGVWGP